MRLIAVRAMYLETGLQQGRAWVNLSHSNEERGGEVVTRKPEESEIIIPSAC